MTDRRVCKSWGVDPLAWYSIAYNTNPGLFGSSVSVDDVQE